MAVPPVVPVLVLQDSTLYRWYRCDSPLLTDLSSNNNKLVLILTRHTLARAGLANRLLDRHEVVTDNGDVVTLRQATP